MKNNEGFSLIEMIIVVAILAIMSVGAAAGFGYLNLANASKCASKIDSGVTLLKSKNMANATPTYMHLYQYDGDYYIQYNDDSTYTPTASDYDEGECIGNNRLTITYRDGNAASATTLGEGACKTLGIRKKDGAFTGTTEPTCIITVKGQSSYQVTLVTNTGKHFRDR